MIYTAHRLTKTVRCTIYWQWRKLCAQNVFLKRNVFWMWGSHSSDYKQHYLPGCDDPAAASCLAYSLTIKMERVHSCKMSVNHWNIQLHVPQDIYLLTYSWSWALLEKLPIVQPLKNFRAFYGTRRFITAFTRALHWSLQDIILHKCVTIWPRSGTAIWTKHWQTTNLRQ
jgi:hypothetical protein